jgi:hypothetical protein
MAADAPFGLSFGDPRKYMGQSPLAEIGKAAKTGLMLYGLQQTGAIDALDKLGVKPNKAGGFSYNNPTSPTGSVPPVAPASAAMAPVAPSATGSPVMPSGPVSYPVAEPAPFSGAVSYPPTAPAPLIPPPNLGVDILDGKFNGVETSFVNPQAQRDSLVLPQQTGYNQMLASGNEYQQVPGYGKLAKVFQAFSGGMG